MVEHLNLRQLHWLPVRQRVQFKVAVLVFQCLSGNAQMYLLDDCQLIVGVDSARPTRRCVLFDARTTSLAIGVSAAPRLRNSLPPNYDNATLSESSRHICSGTKVLC